MASHALIIADIEGIIGVHETAQCKPGTKAWENARHLITEDVNAAIGGLVKAGFSEFTVQDMHGTGVNLLPEKLDSRATLRQHHYLKPVALFGHMPKADIAVMVGWHAARDQVGFSPHMFHKKLQKAEINGSPVTEVEIFSIVLGEFGIPMAFVSGEDVACRRIKENMPWVHTFEVPKTPLTQSEILTLRETLEEEVFKAASQQNHPLFPWGPDDTATLLVDGEEGGIKGTSATELFRIILNHSALTIRPLWILPPLLMLHRMRCRFQEWLRLRTKARRPPETT